MARAGTVFLIFGVGSPYIGESPLNKANCRIHDTAGFLVSRLRDTQTSPILLDNFGPNKDWVLALEHKPTAGAIYERELHVSINDHKIVTREGSRFMTSWSQEHWIHDLLYFLGLSDAPQRGNTS